MASLRQLTEQRAAVWAQMKELHERGARKTDDNDVTQGLTAEERAEWDRLDGEFSRLDAEVARQERAAELDARFADIDDRTHVVGHDGRSASRDQYTEAFGLWLRSGPDGLTPEQRQIMRANWTEQRAQGETSGSAGGYLVPQGFWEKVTETMKFFGGIMGNVELITTATGNDIPWPTNDDTSNVGALLAENTQVTEQDLTFGQKTLRSWTYTSKLVRVSLQLLQDSAIDVDSFVARKLGERLGRIHNTHWTIGDGASKPQGIVTGATTGKTTAGATAITSDELIDLQHSVDPAYRAGARFMWHDSVLQYVRKLKDTTNQPIFQASFGDGAPATIHGSSYIVNNDMASSIATTNKTALFGDFSAGYVARMVAGGQLLRLTERYADFLQVGFLAFDRIDGLVQDSSAYKALVQA